MSMSLKLPSQVSTGALSTPSLSDDGVLPAIKNLLNFLPFLPEINNPELEASFKSILRTYGEESAVSKYESTRSTAKKTERKIFDIISSRLSQTAPTPNQIKNHFLRFGLDDISAKQPQQRTWHLFGNKNQSTNIDADVSHDYEDIISTDIFDAPITEICVIQRGDSIPNGFYRISKSVGNWKANLNTGSGGNNIYLCIKKDIKEPPITSLIVFFANKGEFLPPGYSVVKRGSKPCNINSGTSADTIFLAYKREKVGNPLIDLQIIFPEKNEELPRNFVMIDKTSSGLSANLNAGTGGSLQTYLTCFI